MTTFFAPNRIALLQQNLLVAVTAYVLCGESGCGVELSGGEGGCRRSVGFARHVDVEQGALGTGTRVRFLKSFMDGKQLDESVVI